MRNDGFFYFWFYIQVIVQALVTQLKLVNQTLQKYRYKIKKNDTVKYKGKTNSYPKSQNGNSSSNILRFGDKDEDHFLFSMALHKNETFH